MTERTIHVSNPIGELQGIPFAGVPKDERLGTLKALGSVQFPLSKAEMDVMQTSTGELLAVVKREDGSLAGRFKIALPDIAVALMASLDEMSIAHNAGLASEEST